MRREAAEGTAERTEEETPSPWLGLIGIGEDGLEGLSPPARAFLAAAEAVYGGQRHLALAAPLVGERGIPWPHPLKSALPEILARRGRKTAVLASGDPFWFGVGSLLAEQAGPGAFIAFPAPSSFQLACARLGWALQHTVTLSFATRPLPTLWRELQPGARLLALSRDGTTPGTIAAMLTARGFGESEMVVLEALGGPRERIRRTRAAEFAFTDIDPLNLTALTLAAAPDAQIIPRAPGLGEEFFEHDGQITKREIRAAALAALAPYRGALLWDVGAGSGAIGIEWMLADPANRAIAIERDPGRAARIRRNAEALGVPALEVRNEEAPAAFTALPPPDAVFVGGGARDPALLEAAWRALPRGGRLVVHAVALETEAVLYAAFQRWGGEMCRIGVDRLGPLGGLHGFRPAMRVLQWTLIKS
jgi:precorrin-6Y C5,15-methyltransferase (decarboxylating)